MRSGAEIEAGLRAFVKRWNDYAGSERSEAQTYLNDLFMCFGTNRKDVGALFEDFTSSAGFMDLHWPGVLIVEMKKPGTPLAKADDQRVRYWQESSNAAEGIPAARWVILCNFQEFEIWEPGRFPKEPRVRLTLEELPDKFEALMFLQQGDAEPIFSDQRRELTTEAAEHIAQLYTSMADRGAAPVTEIQRFTMQLVWCMFAEDLKLLDGLPLSHAVETILAEKEPNSAKEFNYLFGLLNKKSDAARTGAYSGTRYVNGDLFAEVDAPLMTRDELLHLRKAVEFDWRQVNPTIFGSLLEGVLGQARRSALGAHYTHEADIMKIVTPTIVRPWRERIGSVTSVSGGLDVLNDLCSFKVLDPACGCGNFLYVAYRELRALEYELKQKLITVAEQTGTPKPSGPLPYVPLTNMYGIDIEHVAIQIARVVLWMGHRQVMEQYGEAEAPLPLVSLPGLVVDDALSATWPAVDVIIGNPPFLGAKYIRPRLGSHYADWLVAKFGVGVKDLCVYWFRRAHDHLGPGQRAGLVGTNSVGQTSARSGSLDYIASHAGVITDAVSSQKWPGEAKVHVSIVNWVREPSAPVEEFRLNGRDVQGITSSLAPASEDGWVPVSLPANRGICYAGVVPQGKGFLLDSVAAHRMLADSSASLGGVVKPYLMGDDITTQVGQGPSRWIIDFGSMSLERATAYPKAIDHLRATTKLEREQSSNQAVEQRWWLFGRRVEEMRAAIAPLARFAGAAATGKRLQLAWIDAGVVPSNTVIVFAVDGDYSMGVLTSQAHQSWAWAQSSTLETRLRYTNNAVFATFPWPTATDAQRDAVSSATKALYERRSELCVEHNMGLTKLYNLMDEGGFQDLRALHKALDEAVADAYGWPKSIAQNAPELVRRLRELNRERSEGS